MAISPYHISSLLDKMNSVDKDFRFMATNDLMTELQKDSIKLDDDSERKVVQGVLKLVEDKNGEVQNLAVKCLGPLVRKVKDSQTEVIINSLSTSMFSDDERLRDISSVGLKTVIAEFSKTPRSVVANASRNITGRLVEAITRPDLNQYVLLETLDILSDLIRSYGNSLAPFHDPLVKALMPLLVDPKPVSVRKRAYTVLCYVSGCCQQALFEAVVFQLQKGLQTQPQSQINIRTYIHAIGAISRQAGQRVGSYLPTMFPLIMGFITSPEGDDELKESGLQTFEALVGRCFREVTPYIPQIVEVSLKMLSHDPNYNYDSDDEEAVADDDMDAEDYEEEDDEYSDDDDVSWKVRRAAAKCLAAALGSRPEMLTDFYKNVSPLLIARFKEREDTVKVDIFAAYQALLASTTPFSRSQLSDLESMEVSESPLSLLHAQVPSIVRSLHKQMRDKSTKTRQSCFSLLTSLMSVLPGALDEHVGAIVPGILYSLNDQTSSSNMKIDALNFLSVLLSQHSASSLHPHIRAIVPAVVVAVDDSFYKIMSEALLVLTLIVKTIRPLDGSCTFDFHPYVQPIYSSALKRLRAADIDQEVKERAITCMGQVIASMGDTLKAELPECLPIFVDRLRNEITRLTAVRAVTLIARSPLKIDINFILPDCVPLLAGYLRKNHRDLKLASLNCLNAFFQNYTSAMNEALYKTVMHELAVLISDGDLHISQLVLTLLGTVMNISPSSIREIHEAILPNIHSLVLSSLLQGSAMTACLSFFAKLVTLHLPGLGFDEIFALLTSRVYGRVYGRGRSAESGGAALPPPSTLHRQAYRSLSMCIAAICESCPAQIIPTVQRFISDVKNPSSPDSVKMLSLLSLGEIGKSNDLSTIGKVHLEILNVFGSQSEDVRSAASYALGSVSAGNLQTYLPFILSEIQSNQKRQYLLLHSLKEVITCHYISPEAIATLKPLVPHIWDVLFTHFESVEEGTRNVVAECVGKLTLVDPQTLLGKLQANLKSPSAYVRGTAVTALKYTISDQPQPIDSLLHECIADFLSTIGDPDLNVRRVALVAFNSAAHNKPSLIRDLLSSILPNLYQETKVRKELIREVEMGPFKHTVDDGLDLRKAAFECMYTLMETCLEQLDVFQFLSHIEDGLKDHYDIRMLTFLLLVRLSHLRPAALLQRIEKLIEPLRSTIQGKAKANSVKQEFEKQDELKRSAMRAVAALLTIPESGKTRVGRKIHPCIISFAWENNIYTFLNFQSVK
jgi:cullin-associated NEDD8-dissociated protein 1